MKNPTVMTAAELIAKAKELATRAHTGQKRWGGEPYIIHPEAVAKMCLTTDEKVVAWLHDVVEDTNITLDDLRADFPEDIVLAVDAITKREGEDYLDYLSRVMADPTATVVKIKDITHNLQNLKKGSMKDKYLVARRLLELADGMGIGRKAFPA